MRTALITFSIVLVGILVLAAQIWINMRGAHRRLPYDGEHQLTTAASTLWLVWSRVPGRVGPGGKPRVTRGSSPGHRPRHRLMPMAGPQYTCDVLRYCDRVFSESAPSRQRSAFGTHSHIASYSSNANAGGHPWH
jgi:hypothetical protein